MIIRVRATGAAVDAGDVVSLDEVGVLIRSEWFPPTDRSGLRGYSLTDFTADFDSKVSS